MREKRTEMKNKVINLKIYGDIDLKILILLSFG